MVSMTSSAQVPVQLPVVTATSGDTFDIPITAGATLDGEGIISYDLTIEYDPAVINITGVRTDGTLTSGWSVSANTGETGQIRVSSSNATALSGGPGTLVILEAEALAGSGSSTALRFVEFKLNSDNVPSTAASGLVAIGALPPSSNLIINEVHVDPANDLAGDANNDSVRDASDDEFIEIVNADAASIDLSGYTLSDEVDVRFVFPAGTTLSPNTAAVVFGGGTPTDIPGQVFTASGLGFNNGGDTITLHDETGAPVAAVHYSDGAIVGESVTRSPDIDGFFTAHSVASPTGALYSPGRTLDGGVLPVELSRFEALRDGQDAVLHWTTASETNNSGFTVQQLYDDETFREIAFVEGAGTTSQAQRYTYRVRDLPAGMHTFRLEQVDFDGTTTSSSSVEISIPLAEPFVLTAAYPNPFHGTATLSLEVRETQDVSVMLYNILGQRVQHLFDGTVRAGSPQPLTIDGSHLPSGVYVYRVQGRTFSATQQIAHVK